MTFERSDVDATLVFGLIVLALTVALSFVPIGDASAGIGVVSVTASHGGLP